MPGLMPLAFVVREILFGMLGAFFKGGLLVSLRLCLGEGGAHQAEYAAEKNQLSDQHRNLLLLVLVG